MNIAFTLIMVLLIFYPLYFIVIASISDPNAIYQGRVWLLPKGMSLDGYKRIFSSNSIWTGYRNTVFYAALGTAINLALTLPCAYSLSRTDLYGRNGFMFFITLTMFFSGGLIPTYLTVRNFHMINNVFAMIIPNAVSAYNLIVARTFFQTTIPRELYDAGKIDGCNDWKFFFRIVIPLSNALIAIMVLFYGVGHWNAYFNALIYLRDEKLYPLQLVLRGILIQNEVGTDMIGDITAVSAQQNIADLIKYGMIVVSSVPLLVLYPLLQKYFVKGVMIGAIKG